MNKPKLLWVSDSPICLQVGQSRVTREFCERLKNDFDLIVGGFIHNDNFTRKYSYPIVGLSKSQNLNNDLIALFEDFNPDIAVFSHDCWLFPYIPTLKKKYQKTKIVGYFTIDGDPIHPSWRSIFESCDLVLSPSFYGKEVIRRTYGYIPVEVCYYGINKDLFSLNYDRFKTKDEYKIACKEAISNKLLKNSKLVLNDINDISNKFVVLFTGAFSLKRNPGVLIDAFNDFSINKNDVQLWMIGNNVVDNISIPFGIGGQLDLNTMRIQSSIDKIFIVYDPRILDDVYKNIYLQSDLYVLPSLGEGFGLPIFEAMACETVPIVTAYTTGPEFIINSGCGWLIPVSSFFRSSFSVRRAIVDCKILSNKIEEAYLIWKNEREKFEDMRKKGREFVSQFDWDRQTSVLKSLLFAVLLDYEFSSNMIEI